MSAHAPDLLPWLAGLAILAVGVVVPAVLLLLKSRQSVLGSRRD